MTIRFRSVYDGIRTTEYDARRSRHPTRRTSRAMAEMSADFAR